MDKTVDKLWILLFITFIHIGGVGYQQGYQQIKPLSFY